LLEWQNIQCVELTELLSVCLRAVTCTGWRVRCMWPAGLQCPLLGKAQPRATTYRWPGSCAPHSRGLYHPDLFWHYRWSKRHTKATAHTHTHMLWCSQDNLKISWGF